jgi:hypothetical protein
MQASTTTRREFSLYHKKIAISAGGIYMRPLLQKNAARFVYRGRQLLFM